MSTPRLTPKLRFYRQCRLWHGYLSACAFLALLFFATTGIALNHPHWFAADEQRSPPVTLTLTASQLDELRHASVPAERLAAMLDKQTTLYGAYQEGQLESDQLFVRLRGARGSTDIRANLHTGSVVIDVERTTTLGLLNALHRGEHAGAPWRMFIDITAAVLIVLSLVGYTIFVSMSARLGTALLISALSVLAIVALFAATVR